MLKNVYRLLWCMPKAFYEVAKYTALSLVLKQSVQIACISFFDSKTVGWLWCNIDECFVLLYDVINDLILIL